MTRRNRIEQTRSLETWTALATGQAKPKGKYSPRTPAAEVAAKRRLEEERAKLEREQEELAQADMKRKSSQRQEYKERYLKAHGIVTDEDRRAAGGQRSMSFDFLSRLKSAEERDMAAHGGEPGGAVQQEPERKSVSFKAAGARWPMNADVQQDDDEDVEQNAGQEEEEDATGAGGAGRGGGERGGGGRRLSRLFSAVKLVSGRVARWPPEGGGGPDPSSRADSEHGQQVVEGRTEGRTDAAHEGRRGAETLALAPVAAERCTAAQPAAVLERSDDVTEAEDPHDDRHDETSTHGRSSRGAAHGRRRRRSSHDPLSQSFPPDSRARSKRRNPHGHSDSHSHSHGTSHSHSRSHSHSHSHSHSQGRSRGQDHSRHDHHSFGERNRRTTHEAGRSHRRGHDDTTNRTGGGSSHHRHPHRRRAADEDRSFRRSRSESPESHGVLTRIMVADIVATDTPLEDTEQWASPRRRDSRMFMA